MRESGELFEIEEKLRMINRIKSAEWVKRLGKIPPSHAFIIEKLDRKGPLKVSDLADFLGITAGAVTGISDKLIAEGYLKRSRAKDDRRVVYLELTEEGSKALAGIRKTRKEMFSLMFGGLSDEDKGHIIRIYEQILNNLQQLGED